MLLHYGAAEGTCISWINLTDIWIDLNLKGKENSPNFQFNRLFSLGTIPAMTWYSVDSADYTKEGDVTYSDKLNPY